jgi:hypothetical protein
MANVRRWIYGLIDPRNEEVRYVGMTTNPAIRCVSHLCDGKRVSRKRCARDEKSIWIGELVSAGMEPRFAILQEIPAGNRWRSCESNWTILLLMEGHRLTNISFLPVAAYLKAMEEGRLKRRRSRVAARILRAKEIQAEMMSDSTEWFRNTKWHRRLSGRC